MNLLPKTHHEFSQKDYWEDFFKKRGAKAFEWYGEYPELCGHLHKYIKVKDNVLVVGCGNSSLSSDLYDVGYKNVTNIDISEVVIRQMLNLHEKERPQLKYLQMDVFNMNFSDELYSVVLDKGTLDALMPDGNGETQVRILKYFKEIERVLKRGGRYICISLLQKHILDFILSYFPSNNWMFRVVRCFDAEKKNQNAETSLPVFMVICTKFIVLPQKILEVNMSSSDKMERLKENKDVAELVSSIQQAAFVCSSLRRSNIAKENDIWFDFYRPKENIPRYTIHIVDLPRDPKNLPYAAFIVPQGREVEWMFSTNKGRKHLAKMVKYNRLAVISMHRGHTYESLVVIQNELQEAVCDIAPEGLTGKILFLSLSDNVGNRKVCYEGKSTMSGNYIVEDVEIIANEKYRRLFYLTTQFIVQSEVKLKTIKSNKGPKEVVDHLQLRCKHHVYMSIYAEIACNGTSSPSIAVIGLGGGGLCMFLRKFLPNAKITAIDIDNDMLEVAQKWFSLKIDNKLRVRIMDGIEFLHESAEKVEKFDAILFDVDSKDTSIGMSCPPAQFIMSTTLNNAAKCISDRGLLIINAVMRDESLRMPLLQDLKNKFPTVVSYSLDEDLNEVLACSSKVYEKNDFLTKVTQANNTFEEFLHKNKTANRDGDEISHFLQNLYISVT
ncbi:hypothetical protein FQA39_LY10092 [Lamprigera yunnana]|nr:hypothetical protein FQA39_LY10092 [Lamprigera yunnana]